MKKRDYTGEVLGILHVEKFIKSKNAWKCNCECGNVVYRTSQQLIANKPKSCGCRGKNLVGMNFGRLKVLKRTHERDSNYNVYYECECNCKDTNKNIKKVTGHDLLCGAVKSCGCLSTEHNKKRGKELGEETKKICIQDTNVRNLTSKMPKNNTSGIKGVTWDKARSKWMAQIVFQKKIYHLGRYDTLDDAAAVRAIAEDKLFGNFLNWYNNEFKNKEAVKKEDAAETVVDVYSKTGGLVETAQICGIGWQKVRRILIAEGKYENETSLVVKELYESGMGVEQISEKLKINPKTVNSYLPYSKGEYGLQNPTDNAKRIRKYRSKNT